MKIPLMEPSARKSLSGVDTGRLCMAPLQMSCGNLHMSAAGCLVTQVKHRRAAGLYYIYPVATYRVLYKCCACIIGWRRSSRGSVKVKCL